MSENIPPVETVRSERHGAIYIVTIDRPTVRNAVDGPTAAVLARPSEALMLILNWRWPS